ncbi:MAG: MFS transporter [Clostridia bacterium]
MGLVKRLNIYSGLPRSIYVHFVIRIINAMGNFVYPFLTFFLTERLGFSAEAAGEFFLLSAVFQGVGSIVGGKLTDHIGRKKLLLGFMGLSALCFFPCIFLGNSILIPVFLILSGMFAGAAQPVSSAMLTDLTKKENRRQAFSLLYMGTNIGFSIGPMIAGFLYKNHTNWIFYGNAFAILISLVLILLFIGETMPNTEDVEQEEDEGDDEAAEKGSALDAFKKRPVLMLFSIGRLVNQLVYSCIGFAIPLQLAQSFGSSLGPRYFGIIMSFTGIVVITFTVPATKLTLRLKPLINMALAGFFYAVGFGMIGFIGTLPLFLLSAFIFTVGEVLEATNAGVYIANHSPITHRGRFNALITMIMGTGNALGPYLFGKYITTFGLFELWILCFSLTFASGIFMLWLRYYERSRERRVVEQREDQSWQA